MAVLPSSSSSNRHRSLWPGSLLTGCCAALVVLLAAATVVSTARLSDIDERRFYQWPNGAVIERQWRDGGEESIRVSYVQNGSSRDQVIGVGATESARGEAKVEELRDGAQDPDYYSGWVEYSGYVARGNVTRLYTRWTVPPAPPHYNILTTVFLFAGLEADANHDVNDIIQPVLQYGHSGCGGGKHWSAASFYVVGLTAHCGKTLRVETGDVIEANITYANESQLWTLVTTAHSQIRQKHENRQQPQPSLEFPPGNLPGLGYAGTQSSVLQVHAIHAYHWAMVTLEAIRVYSCSAYPSGHSTEFNAIVVEVDHAVVREPSWNKTIHYHECGQAVSVVNAQTCVMYYNATTQP